ncbi:hypothetical protein AJ80_00189 [Polytolypa hystricis UAMH7299]|uniref:Stress-response A/B barrel domain-containing protein n=1 Tax=Polytolypa hystricis (strain UAMH7299) TaxID=1447883 RepID=A0A2B7Z2V1_POLH7|nr:hypothetical protein AJ80_00189 [Polytolypa hystricis UAMH7299]
MPITRVTMFKIPDPEHQKQVLEKYKSLAKEAMKDGKLYILSLTAGRPHDDPRRKGYTVTAISRFASMEDMQYYDSQCAAHASLKQFVGPLKEDVMTVFFEADVEA